MIRTRTATALLSVVLLVAGCGSDDEGGGAAAGDGAPDGGGDGAATAADGDRCEPVPGELVSRINSTLTGGTAIEDVEAVRSQDFEEAYFIAGRLTGPGIDDGGEPIVFVTNALDGPGTVYAVGGVAGEFSELGRGEKTRAGFSSSDDGFDAAQDCLA